MLKKTPFRNPSYFLAIILVIIMILQIQYIRQEPKFLMDDFCQSARNTNMSEYKSYIGGYYKFKCGNEEVIFQSDFMECKKNKWEEKICHPIKTNKSILKVIFSLR